MSDANHEKFRELIDKTHNWPDYYVWKFIVKAEAHDQVVALLVGHEITVKESGKGTYVSINARKLVNTTDEVLEIYKLVSEIPGVLSL